MTKISEPKSLLEVRAWKRKASAKIARLGFEAFHAKAEAEFAEVNRRIAKKRPGTRAVNEAREWGTLVSERGPAKGYAAGAKAKKRKPRAKAAA